MVQTGSNGQEWLVRSFDEACPDVSNVIEFLMIIPSSTAEVERFFKTLKAMKSKLRNRLSSLKLKKLFMIQHFLDLENYDLDRVFEIFKLKLQERQYVKSIQDKQRRAAKQKKEFEANRAQVMQEIKSLAGEEKEQRT